MIFDELYKHFEQSVLFEICMNTIVFFKGTKNEFEKIRSKEFKGIGRLKIESLNVNMNRDNPDIDLPMIQIEVSKVQLFRVLEKAGDKEK